MAENSYLKFSTFKLVVTIAVTVLIVIFGVMAKGISTVDTKAEKNQSNISEINGSIKEINTNIKWIKENLDKLVL